MIISDSTVTHTTHRRTIKLEGPVIKTDKMRKKQHKFKVDTVHLIWHDDELPEFAHVHGTCEGKHKARDTRGFKLDGNEPDWLKEAINGTDA